LDRAAIRALARPPGVGAFETLRLPNGLEVVVGRKSGSAVVTVGLGLRGGRASAAPGVVELASTLARPESHYQGRPLDYGARARAFFGEDRSTELIQAGSGNVANVLAVLSESVRSMDVPMGIMPEVREKLLPSLKSDVGRPESQGEAAFWKALYGNHPYGR